MNISLDSYRIFCQVVRSGSITLAAGELYISQPAVSQAVRQLEKSLGGSLFVRTSRGVKLTPEGEILYDYVGRGYDLIAQGEGKFMELLGLEAGEIRIGASDMTLQYYLLPFLEEFHRNYPKIRVKVTNAPTPDTVELLHAGKIDFGVVSAPIREQAGLEILPVAMIRDIFVAGDKFSTLRGRPVALQELAEYPLICLEENTSTRRYVDSFLQESGVRLCPEFELATSDLIVQFTLRHLGIGSVVANFAEKQLDEGTLFEIELERQPPSRELCVITAQRQPISPAGKKLLELLQNKP